MGQLPELLEIVYQANGDPEFPNLTIRQHNIMNMKIVYSLPVFLLFGCGGTAPPTVTSTAPPVEIQTEQPPVRVIPKNAIFTTHTTMPKPKVTVSRLELPAIPQANAIWGATGRDVQNTLYFGVSCDGAKPSAQLLSFKPDSGVFETMGDAVKATGTPGIGQAKIHTKILQAEDGYLYFASMDEEGEKEDGSQLPTYGSHLFRTKPGSARWELLKHVPEGVVTAGTNGRYVYFLGYFGHVLYQWDIRTAKWASARVGSLGGHICRNLVVDRQGHVFVPRVKAGDARLVEYDEYLLEVRTTPLSDYSISNDADSHGIVGVAAMADGSVCFTTDQGRLYRTGPSGVVDLGPIHPQGRCYPAGLFCVDGGRYLVAFASMPGRKDMEYEVIVRDLDTKTSVAAPVAFPVEAGARNVLVYGSTTRDDAGAMYLVGRYTRPGSTVTFSPCIWKVVLD
jgi:hypothetical protein